MRDLVAWVGLASVVALATAPSTALSAAAPVAAPDAVLAAVEKACVPLILGQPLPAVATASGMSGRGNVLTLGMANRKQVRITPVSPANPTVCQGTVTYEPGGSVAIVAALEAWAAGKMLQKQRLGETTQGFDGQYRTTSWIGPITEGNISVVFAEKLDATGQTSQQANLVVNLNH
jgi:hypothetical protein